MLRAWIQMVVLVVFATLVGCDSDSVGEVPGGRSGSPDISLALEPQQMDWVGQKIFQNECAGRFQCLVHWNEGELFPSLGIGHFIWYPKDVQGRFVESFPELIRYMSQRQASVPDWLLSLEPFDAPWPDRANFLAASDSTRVAELREFLAGTQGIQAEFIFRRAQSALGAIIQAAPEGRRGAILGDLKALSATPGGVYALMDYVNFKGEGLAPGERYQGEGWGLLQVLVSMGAEPGDTALDRFRSAAATVLTRRARNAENAIERERWLAGWLKRVESYREPAPGPAL